MSGAPPAAGSGRQRVREVTTHRRETRRIQGHNTQRILLVEDDRDLLAGLFFALTEAGYSVLTAEDGAQAVDLLSRS